MVVSAAARLAYAWVISRRKPLNGGPIRLVRDGDQIRINVKEQTLDVLVDPSELDRRRQEWAPLPARYTRGVLHKYARLVGSASHGAVLRLTCPSIATSRTCAMLMSSSRMAASGRWIDFNSDYDLGDLGTIGMLDDGPGRAVLVDLGLATSRPPGSTISRS